MRYKAPLYTVIVLVVMLYDVLTLKTGILKQPFFPCVNTILVAIIEDRKLLLVSTLGSLKLLFTGYFIGGILGLITGVACGYNKKINYWVSPIIKLLGPIPSTTWIPIIMVLVSSLFKGSAFIIGLGVWFAMTIASQNGTKMWTRHIWKQQGHLEQKDISLYSVWQFHMRCRTSFREWLKEWVLHVQHFWLQRCWEQKQDLAGTYSGRNHGNLFKDVCGGCTDLCISQL